MRIAVLGLGSAGRRHAANAAMLGHEVVVYDPALGEPPEAAQRADSEAEAIAGADAVVVATPNSLHADQAIAALEAGRPVLVEKPLAVHTDDAERVVRAAAGTVAAVAMNLRFHPAVVEMKRRVDDGALGPVRLAESSFGYDLRLWRPESDYRASYSARAELGGGIALDAIHEFDYLLWMLGPVETVSGETAHLSTLELDVEDTALAVLRFAAGAMATVSLNFFEPAYRRGAVIVGEEASVQWVWGEGSLRLRGRDGNVRMLPVASDLARTYVDLLADFVAAAESGSPPRTPLEEGLEATRVVAALKRSAKTGRRIEITSE